MKYSVRLILNERHRHFDTGIITTNHIPNIGEKINTILFALKYEERLHSVTMFDVVSKINYYNDDFSEIDYIEIGLKKTSII